MSSPVWLNVLPKMSGFGGPLLKQAKTEANKAGKQAGASFTDAMDDQVDKGDAGAAYVKKLETHTDRAVQAVSKEKVAISSAREQSVSATQKLEKAEEALETAREKGDPGAVALAEAKLESAREKQRAASEKLERQDRSLAGAVDELKVAQGQLDRATSATADELRDLESASGRSAQEMRDLDRVSGTTAAELRDAGKAADSAGNDVEDSGEQADQAEGGWTLLAGAVGAAVGALAGMGAAYEQGVSALRSEGTLEAALGLDPAEAKVAGKTAGNVWAGGWGESMDEATLATQQTYMYLGDGPDTQWLTEAALGYQQAFGTDTQGSIGAVSQMLRTGLAPDAKSAFDLMTAGAQQGADKAGDLADTYTEYGTLFRNLGLDGSTSMGLLVQGLNAGARDADKVADAFKELSIRSVDGSKTTAEGFQLLGLNAEEMQGKFAAGGQSAADATQQVLEKLRGIEDPALRSQAAVALFGTQAEDLGDALFALDLDTASGQLGDFSGSTEQMKGALSDTLGPLERVGRMFSGFGTWIGTNALPYVHDFLDGVQGVITLLTTGDFTGAESMFGFEEDSAFVGFLFTVRDVLTWVYEQALVPIGAWVSDNQGLVLTVIGGIAGGIGLVAGVLAGGAVAAGISALFGALSSGVLIAAGVVTGIAGVVTWLTVFFTQTETGRAILGGFWEFVQAAVAGFVDWWTATAWPAIQFGLDILTAGFAAVWPVVSSVFTAVGSFLSEVLFGVVIPALQQFAGYIVNDVGPIVQRLWLEYVQPAFLAIGAFVLWAWQSVIRPALTGLSTFIGEDLGPKVIWFWESVISPAFSLIGAAITWAWNSVIFPALDGFKYFLTQILAPTVMWLWENVVSPAFAGISWAISAAWAVGEVIFALIDWTIRNVVGPVFTWLLDSAVRPAWDTISSVLETGWSFIRDNIFEPLRSFIGDKISPAFDSGVDGIGGAWDRLRGIAMAPVRFVVDSVINKGIIDNFNKVAGVFGTSKIDRLTVPGMPSGGARGTTNAGGGRSMAFASGGTLPGYTPGRDVHQFYSPTGGRLDLSGGEAIMVPEWTRAVGGAGAVASMNRKARAGEAFANGGIWEGDNFNAAKRLGGFLVDVVTDPKDALTKLVGRLVPDPAEQFGKLAVAVPKKIASDMGSWLVDKIAPDTMAAGPVGPMPAGASRSLGYAQQVARSYGLTMTSFRRPGARTAGSGMQSLHALSRAMDFSNSSGPTPQMMGFFNAMHALRPLELLYSAAGGRQWRRSGRQADTSGATRRNHWNHVHVGFADGGVFGEQSWPALQGYAGGGILPPPVRPILYDQGGWLQPGLSVVENRTGRPEPVFTGPQGDSIRQILEDRRGAPARMVSVPITATQLSEADVDKLADELLRRISMMLLET